jgi:hypothetical protein
VISVDGEHSDALGGIVTRREEAHVSADVSDALEGVCRDRPAAPLLDLFPSSEDFVAEAQRAVFEEQLVE